MFLDSERVKVAKLPFLPFLQTVFQQARRHITSDHEPALIYTHSEHRFPAPSAKLWQTWLHHRRSTLYLRAAVHRRYPRLWKVTIQIISGVSFITASVACASTNKPKSFEWRRNSFYPGWIRLVFTCVLGRCVVSTVLLVRQTFRRALIASADSCAEIKSAPIVV